MSKTKSQHTHIHTVAASIVCCYCIILFDYFILLFQTLWIERTTYTSSSSFPGVIGWFEVVKTETVRSLRDHFPLFLCLHFLPHFLLSNISLIYIVVSLYLQGFTVGFPLVTGSFESSGYCHRNSDLQDP